MGLYTLYTFRTVSLVSAPRVAGASRPLIPAPFLRDGPPVARDFHVPGGEDRFRRARCQGSNGELASIGERRHPWDLVPGDSLDQPERNRAKNWERLGRTRRHVYPEEGESVRLVAGPREQLARVGMQQLSNGVISK